jgi:glyoxylase-like metal-dependent hydrolase (beta-lactamase superfamily II)
MRFLWRTLVFLVTASLVVAMGVLAWGHIHVRRIEPPLPTLDAVLAPAPSGELPVALHYVNTATQPMPRSNVLESSLDPNPEAPYAMGHPAFVVEWSDGRIFLIDLGMSAAGAMSFGRPLEALGGADRMQPHTSTSERLADARARIAGIAFTHMHVDHTGGIEELCNDLRAEAARIPVFQGRYQMREVNHTTRGAKIQLEEADCIERRPLVSQESIQPIPGFPGLSMIAAAGHTPGSQIFVVELRAPAQEDGGGEPRSRTWVITGDVVNHIQAVELDIPKPGYYSLLVVPENTDRLAQVRGFLRQLARRPGVQLLVSHDFHQVADSGLAEFEPGKGAGTGPSEPERPLQDARPAS